MLLNILKDCVIISQLINTNKVETMKDNERREFLKKVAYKAPVVVGLGSLAAPLSVHASNVSTSPFNSSNDNNDNTGSSNGGLD